MNGESADAPDPKAPNPEAGFTKLLLSPLPVAPNAEPLVGVELPNMVAPDPKPLGFPESPSVPPSDRPPNGSLPLSPSFMSASSTVGVLVSSRTTELVTDAESLPKPKLDSPNFAVPPPKAPKPVEGLDVSVNAEGPLAELKDDWPKEGVAACPKGDAAGAGCPKAEVCPKAGAGVALWLKGDVLGVEPNALVLPKVLV